MCILKCKYQIILFLSFRFEIEKPPPERKITIFRKTRSIDTESFMNDVRVRMSKLGSCYNIEDRVDEYKTILSQLQDEYAPEKQHTVTSIVWSTVSKATDKSSSTKNTTFCWSVAITISFVTSIRAVSVLWKC